VRCGGGGGGPDPLVAGADKGRPGVSLLRLGRLDRLVDVLLEVVQAVPRGAVARAIWPLPSSSLRKYEHRLGAAFLATNGTHVSAGRKPGPQLPHELTWRRCRAPRQTGAGCLRRCGLRSVVGVREPDAAFTDPRLAVLYDVFDDDRSDLDFYAAIAAEVEARSVIDVGCGTGSLGVLLAERGFSVVGVDPAAASLNVARAKPNAEQVRWIDGDATAIVGLQLDADLAVMTGNVAQVFVSDQDWHQTIEAVHGSLRPGGWFAFETRRPEARAWEEWDLSPTSVTLPGGVTAVASRKVTDVALPLVTFESVTVIGGESLSSSSTLRFRGRSEVERDLDRWGFQVVDVRDAPDRPGKEHVFLARRND
jgi:SAM-dependent methyltransferase